MIQNIGLIGVGRMGLAIARNLIAEGYAVTGYRRSAMDDFAAAGGTPTASPAAVAETSDIILISLPGNDAAGRSPGLPEAPARAASPLPPPAASAVSSRADCVAGPSAAHARRQSAWCGGADGGSVHVCLYDPTNHLAVLVWPREGRVRALELAVSDSPRHVDAWRQV